MERVLLDEQVWAFRVGTATTVLNLSSRPAARYIGPEEALSVLVSTGLGERDHKITGSVLLEPWEALITLPPPS